MNKKEVARKISPPGSGAERQADIDISPAVRYENLPLVVLAGRPNVGKSTLFNRLVGKRRAITDPTPGVTRDPIEEECELWGTGRRVLMADTGGFRLEREGLDELVVARTLAYIERASLILFMVDVTEITPEDEEFAAFLRPYAKKLVLVVNKADSPERDALVWAHARWGFDPILFVSAEHNRNIDELEDAIVARLDFSRVREVEIDKADIRIAIMGKPNTGKSTLLNALVGHERSIVSSEPGTTRDVVEGRFLYKGRGITVLDTAGIRRKKKVTDNVEYYSVTRSIAVVSRADVVILLIDAEEGLSDQDKKIAAFAVEAGRPVVLALSKWDTMPTMKNAFEAARDRLRFFFGQMAYAPVIAISAKGGQGIDKLMSTVVSLYGKANKVIETSRLNQAVAAWVEESPPPAGPHTRFKLRYAVQASVNPQRFIFFVTRPEAVAESYRSFLKNKIRLELGLDGIPVQLELRASRKDRLRS
ncbi:GTPase Der [uncultured spirochete]|uniref:GTPase Der n=1 Tax=uncultured spirochete TaxID=156406 RepID=A0A3P3XMN2_9SPIR|nr:GTPase Der [uncultured spirochete]